MKKTGKLAARVLSLALAGSMMLTSAMADGYVQESIVPVTGAQTGFVQSQGKYYTDFATLEQERAAAKALNIQVAEEGFVLLKNDGILPLAADE